MEEYSVIFSDEAKTDLLGIVDYLNHFSTDIGAKYLSKIQQAAGSLAYMPQRCSFVRDGRLREEGYHWLFVRNYIIFLLSMK